MERAFGTIAAGPWGEDKSLNVEELLALALLRRERRVSTAELGVQVQLDADGALALLEKLMARGLAARNGVGRGRFWTVGGEELSPAGYRAERPTDLGLDERTVEGLLMKELEVAGEGGITPAEVRKWSHLDKDRLTRLMARLVDAGTVVTSGKRGVGSRYWLPGKGPAEGSGAT